MPQSATTPASTQDLHTHARESVTRFHARQIAEQLLRHDVRFSRAQLADLPTDAQRRLEGDAAIVLRMHDPEHTVRAAYYAADQVTPGGITSRTPDERRQIVEVVRACVRAYHDSLRGTEAAVEAGRSLGLLALEDLRAEAGAPQEGK